MISWPKCQNLLEQVQHSIPSHHSCSHHIRTTLNPLPIVQHPTLAFLLVSKPTSPIMMVYSSMTDEACDIHNLTYHHLHRARKPSHQTTLHNLQLIIHHLTPLIPSSTSQQNQISTDIYRECSALHPTLTSRQYPCV